MKRNQPLTTEKIPETTTESITEGTIIASAVTTFKLFVIISVTNLNLNRAVSVFFDPYKTGWMANLVQMANLVRMANLVQMVSTDVTVAMVNPVSDCYELKILMDDFRKRRTIRSTRTRRG